MVILGGMYRKGIPDVVQADFKTSVEYYEKAAKTGNDAAIMNLINHAHDLDDATIENLAAICYKFNQNMFLDNLFIKTGTNETVIFYASLQYLTAKGTFGGPFSRVARESFGNLAATNPVKFAELAESEFVSDPVRNRILKFLGKDEKYEQTRNLIKRAIGRHLPDPLAALVTKFSGIFESGTAAPPQTDVQKTNTKGKKQRPDRTVS
jgi:TPR repeat protein